MVKPSHRVTTVVSRVHRETPRVLTYELADPDNWELPPFGPGAHIDVHVPNGMVRQYSLYGSPYEGTRYRIAVQREEGGRGGSAALQDQVKDGDTLLVSLPRNHFPLAAASSHVFIVGGIGITPIVPMVEAARDRGDAFHVHVCARSPDDVPFAGWVESLADSGHAHLYVGGGERLDVDAVVRSAAPDSHIYCCGPERMIRAVADATADRPPEMVHFEHFGAPVVVTSDPAYEIELARSKRVISVPAGETMLSALREAGVELDASCEGGVCLTCKTRYLAGLPVHRDLVMKAADRREFITPCVSGCASEKLLLDL